MSIWKRLFGGPSSANSQPALAFVEAEYHDGAEDRVPTEFETLRVVMERARSDPAGCLALCLKQIEATPDYDLPRLWASNFQNSLGDKAGALQTLEQGLTSCKKVSNLLGKMGERYIENRSPLLATVCVAKSILAQEPLRSDHSSYLYFSYICSATDYPNAGQKSLAIAQRIWGGPIDLDDETQMEVLAVIGPHRDQLQPLVRPLIAAMLEQGRID
ncbi:MAG: hypothetical protein J0L57_13465 [Burkholderiales bacterium]|nr:hypothetical protein [Burkholderiales bacterium]